MNISKGQTDKYVLYTYDEKYFVEYLLKDGLATNCPPRVYVRHYPKKCVNKIYRGLDFF